MKYAIVQVAGKQLKISEGDTIKLDRQDELSMDVLLFSDGTTLKIGEPILSDVSVTTKRIVDAKDKKVDISRYKSKSRYRRNRSHRQPISVFKIEEISLSEKKKTVKAEKVTEKKAKTATKPVKATKATTKAKPKAKKTTTTKKVKKEKKEK